MARILGIPKTKRQGLPNLFNVRLDFMKTWHERLTFARVARGLSKSELAREIGLSNPTITDWESGEIKKLEGENLINLCDKLKISARWLLFGKGDMEEIILSENDYHAVKINRALGIKERQAWYRAGDSLAEPAEGTNGTQ
jgi:transcriptional regulator with XRE-family HTH domain